MADTVSQTFGRRIADQLAALAIDLACDAPEKIATHDTKVRTALIQETRTVLAEAGIDWRALVRSRVAAESEARRSVYAEKLAVEASKRTTEELVRLLEKVDDVGRPILEAEIARRPDRDNPRPTIREAPCGECGARPVLQGDSYVCQNPGCDGYGQVCP